MAAILSRPQCVKAWEYTLNFKPDVMNPVNIVTAYIYSVESVSISGRSHCWKNYVKQKIYNSLTIV